MIKWLYTRPEGMEYPDLQFSRSKIWKALASFFRNAFFIDPHNRYPLLAALFVNSILWVAILIKIHAENNPIPLHYNAFYGIQFVGPGLLFLQIPLVGLILLGLNSIIGRRVYVYDRFLSTVMCYGSALIQIILLLATISIIILNS